MKTFLKVAGVLIVLFIAVGLILPNQVDVRRSITINAPLESIHKYTNNLEKWSEWSPWVELDTTMKMTLGEIHQGVGASQSWVGESGSGQLKFTASSLQQGIVYNMSFDGDPTVYEAGLSYQSNATATVVTWHMSGEMKPLIIGNYFAQLMDSFVGNDFTKGLEKLKAIAESD